MNIQEYISSGIVESYVLGLTSEEEKSEFEEICIQYPEVLAIRNAFEIALENQAMQNAIAPSADVKNKIFDTIFSSSGRVGSGSSSAKIVSIAEAPVKKINWFKYAAAASVILLAGSLYFNYSLSEKNKKINGDYNNTVAELNTIKKDVQVLTDKSEIKMASLKGTAVSPQSYTTVYWDSTSHDVYLLINNLPKPPSDKQYQLWAFLDGKPIDIGFISNDYFIKQNSLLVKAKSVQKVQAFAISLEKIGREDTSVPAGEVYVYGGL
ncbi:MAG: anti-sigma factor [Chitinophagaceae bacterium]